MKYSQKSWLENQFAGIHVCEKHRETEGKRNRGKETVSGREMRVPGRGG